MKYDLNKINIKSYTPKVGWLGGKEIEIYLWGPRIKFHKITFVLLWSPLKY
jgi:hypothetical protein